MARRIIRSSGTHQIALMNDEARFGQVADDRLDDIVAERAYRIITEPARDEALAQWRAEMLQATGGHTIGE